jgi:putative protein-disulfide isomerase
MKPKIIYCYDAYCGWCYGFSPVIRKIFEKYRDRFDFEVLSGGMILPDTPKHIGLSADYIKSAYKTVENMTGITFGQDYLWHINNPDMSDWFPDSLKPAIALCVFKDYHHELSVLFAADLQYALHYEGRDLTDDEAYRHLLEKYEIPADEFYDKMKMPEYEHSARYEFSLVKQLHVSGFPTMFVQITDMRFYLLSRGYSDFETVDKVFQSVLEEVKNREAEQ